jgi:protein-S-isoprenylcysteine O-methyltransferase Ste14
MKLIDHFTRSGDILFRWRSYLPLALLPVFVLGTWDGAARPPRWDRAWGIGALVVALAGLAVRAWAIATAPRGTSERSTVNPRASVLNTAGVYSLVRHPLYVANTLMALGLSLFPGSWALPVIVLLAALLHYERIAAREESFLEAAFGDTFREYASRVPAMIPRPRAFEPSPLRFRWRKVAGREHHALLVVGSTFLVLDALRHVLRDGTVGADPLWLWLFVLTALIYVAMTALKKTTRVFEIPDEAKTPASSSR